MKKKKVPRAYDSKKRVEQSIELKERILNLAIKLLIKHQGEFSLRKLALKAECSERHLYRIFEGLEGLSEELNKKMNQILDLNMDIKEIKPSELPDYARKLFFNFNKNSDLVKAYLASSLGKTSRALWLKEKHKKISHMFGGLENSEQLIKETSVILSANFWKLLRTEALMTEKESEDYVSKIALQIAKASLNGGSK